MSVPSGRTGSTTVSRIVKAPRQAVYCAYLDADSVAKWYHPHDMTMHIHTFEPREGGKFRISLRYQDAKNGPGGKTSEDTDTYHGTFAKLIPNEKIVQVIEFETQDPGFAGTMRITTTLADADSGTEVTVQTEGIPTGVRPEDNELGSRMALENLAALLE